MKRMNLMKVSAVIAIFVFLAAAVISAVSADDCAKKCDKKLTIAVKKCENSFARCRAYCYRKAKLASILSDPRTINDDVYKICLWRKCYMAREPCLGNAQKQLSECCKKCHGGYCGPITGITVEQP